MREYLVNATVTIACVAMSVACVALTIQIVRDQLDYNRRKKAGELDESQLD